MFETTRGSETGRFAKFLDEEPSVGCVEEVDVSGSSIEDGEGEV